MSEISVRVFDSDLLNHPQYHVPMFQLISTNMDKLFHQDSTSNVDAYQIYFENRIRQTSSAGVKTAIAFDGKQLCGFFQYSINEGAGTATWQEMQIHPDYQGDGKTFPALLRSFLLSQECKKIDRIYGQINDLNKKSQAVFQQMGFQRTEKTERGAWFVCSMQKVTDWFIAKYRDLYQ